MSNSIWKDLAQVLHGNYIERRYYHSDKTEIRYKAFQIVFDHYAMYRTVGSTTLETTYTRIVCPYTSAEGFRFRLYRKSFMDTIGKLFGAQDILINDVQFDKEFIIKSNNEYKASLLLDHKELRELMLSQESVHIEISDQKGIWEEQLPEGHYELSFYSEDGKHTLESLQSLYQMFTQWVDQMTKVLVINPVCAYS